MTSKQGLSKELSDEIQNMIKEFASDKVGVHPTAALIKTLTFATVVNSGVACTAVHAQDNDYFHYVTVQEFSDRTSQLNFYHDDERNCPQHFDIDLVWDELLQNDEILAMGNEDTRSYPSGMPLSDTQHGWGWL